MTEPKHGLGLVDTLIHSGFGVALSTVLTEDWLLKAGSSVLLASISAVVVHFIKVWLERRWPRHKM